jgi:hypothetical protein
MTTFDDEQTTRLCDYCEQIKPDVYKFLVMPISRKSKIGTSESAVIKGICEGCLDELVIRQGRKVVAKFDDKKI